MENLVNFLEVKVIEELVSSKKKEKRKYVDYVESSIFIVFGIVRFLDDLEEDIGNYKVFFRYNIFSFSGLSERVIF